MKNKFANLKSLTTLFAVAMLALFALQSASGQIGYDNTFNGNGRFTYNEVGTNENVVAVLEQPDGKVVVVGETNYDPDEANNSRIIVVRLNPNGSYDNTLGANGKVYIDTPNSTDVPNAAELQSDGKILISGYQGSYKGTVYRLSTNGALDNSFGSGGKAVIAAESVYEFENIKVSSGGKIVVSGVGFIGSRFSYIIARFNTNGQLDNSFNNSGFIKFRTSTSNYEEDNGAGYGLAIQPDGKIVTCGYNEKEDGTVARLNANGTLDPTFGLGGIKYIDFTRKMYLNAIEIQNDEHILIGGTYEYSSSTNKAQILRLLPNGNFDGSWGIAGTGIGWYGNNAGIGNDMSMQCDGKVLIGGSTQLFRVNTDGMLDPSFAINGEFSFTFDYYPNWETLFFQRNKIYLAGGYYQQSGFADQGGFVARFNTDISCGTTPIEEVESEISITLYPNPVRDLLTIQLDNETEVQTISLIDNTGRLILSNDQFYQNDYSWQYNMALLPAGTYFVIVVNAQGRRVMPVVKI
jgi:uncharacterized delta-60 repeat protein